MSLLDIPLFKELNKKMMSDLADTPLPLTHKRLINLYINRSLLVYCVQLVHFVSLWNFLFLFVFYTSFSL